MKRNMSWCLRGVLTMTALAGLVASQPSAVVADAEEKVTICHIPPGNPENAHTIVVGASAVPAHLEEHGDTLGECGGGPGE
jgi:hypothetical protein